MRIAETDRNVALQILRGTAALAVMLYHAAHFTAERTGAAWLEDVLGGRLAYCGVLVFFVLSGYLMEGAVRRYPPGTFLKHRLVRLFPSYWVIALAFVVVLRLHLGAWPDIPWLSLTLLPLGEMYRPLHVEWTLLYEVFFYSVCFLVCFRPQLHLPVHLAWLALVLVAVSAYDQYGSVAQPTLLQLPFSVWDTGFIFGALAGHAVRRLPRVPASTWLWFGVALVLLGETQGKFGMFFASAGFACVVLALVTAPARSTPPGLVARAMFVAGDCSYGLYLAHSLAIQIALAYVPQGKLTQPLSVLAGVVGVGLAVGLAAGVLDIRLYRYLKRSLDRRPVPPAHASVPLPAA